MEQYPQVGIDCQREGEPIGMVIATVVVIDCGGGGCRAVIFCSWRLSCLRLFWCRTLHGVPVHRIPHPDRDVRTTGTHSS